jgi:hypothetical protein
MNNNTALEGNLNFLSLGDIMQLLGSNGSSGILRIHSPHMPEPGIIYFEMEIRSMHPTGSWRDWMACMRCSGGQRVNSNSAKNAFL